MSVLAGFQRRAGRGTLGAMVKTPQPARTPLPAGPPPDRARLHEAALRHLARFAATEAGLIRVLDRRVGRWARAAAAEGLAVDEAVRQSRTAVREVAAALVRAGVVDDAAFAAARANRLARGGRSRRAVAVHLAAKGVPSGVATAALPDAEADYLSALIYARKRRLGPFRTSPDLDTPPDPGARLADLGRLARAGYDREIAERALNTNPAEAEALTLARRG